MIAVAGDGRWGGRVTRRPLPDDPALDTLSPSLRDTVSRGWFERAAAELQTSAIMAVVCQDVVALRPGSEAARLAARAVDDERRHAEICRQVASRYAGTDLALPVESPVVVPRYDGASEEVERLLRIVAQCSIGETIAAVFLEASLEAARGPLARAATRELLGDDVQHARIGWALLAGCSATTRRGVEPWLLPMLRGYVRLWSAATPYTSMPGVREHGLPTPEDVAAAARRATVEVIIPGFDLLGVTPRGLERQI
jgi:hypothetical protein